MRLKILSFMVVFMFLFFSCDSNNSENDESADEGVNDVDTASDSDDNERPDVDEEESCCRIINTAIASNDSGMYIAGHTRDDGYCGCDYYGFYKYFENDEWKTIYVCNEPCGGCADTRQDIWISEKNKAYIVGFWTSPIIADGSEWEHTIGEVEWGKCFGYESRPLDIWGTASTDIFSVGGDDSPRVGAIFHFDGSEWVRMEIPTENELNRVWGSGSDDVFAVGENGTILHYDGEKWSEMESGTVEYLSDVWGSSKDNVYVVGGSYETQEKGTYLILHYDGEKWKEIDSGTSCVLRRIHGTDGDNVYAVGGLMVDGSMRSEVFHYDGKEWTKSTLNTKHGLYDIHAMPDGSFYVVGDNNTIERITP